jgi:hypothetical protein
MYLARRVFNNIIRFIISESFEENGCLGHRDLLDLGTSPQKYIVYSGSSAFYIDDWVIKSLEDKGIEADPFELEELFSPFVDPDVLYRINSFTSSSAHRNWKPLSSARKKRILATTHIFDRRRLHFLRFGQVDQRRLDRSAALYRELPGKSRDEIEQYILTQEQVLTPHDYKLYMIAIFNLLQFFSESYAYTMPEALPQEKLDIHFIDQVCLLDSDEKFWQGLERTERIPDYLTRYVILYFDYSFATGGGWEEYVRNFMDSRRRYTPPKAGKKMTMSEVSTVFGINRSELSSMSRKEIKKLFRKKAGDLHPDKGGDHDGFIELADAYNEIMRVKR